MKNILFKLRSFIFENKNWIVNFVLIFALIIFLMPPSEQWRSNEETYLGLAWRMFSPENLSKISALRDPVYNRFLFDYLTGFSINHIGFEWTHALGRIIVALLYSASLVTLFRSLNLSPIDSYTIILTFVYLHEDILGGESLFKGFEPKTLAYPFVFFSFYTSLKKRFKFSYFLLIIATYFHLLVGVFWSFVTLIGQLYWTRNIKQTLLDSLKYLIACSPLFLMIVVQQLQAQETVNSTPQATWIYSYFRNPHHVAPFASAKELASWSRGILSLFGLTVASVVLYHNSRNKNEKEFSKLILALNLYLIFSLVISYFDENGVLGKFYLFRPSSVTLLLTLCLYVVYLKNRLSKNINQLSFVVLVLISVLAIPHLSSYKSIISSVKSAVPDETPSYVNNLKLEQIIKSSNNMDIFLIDPELERAYLSFERKYNRPTLIYYKFVPTTASEIVRWYKLLNMREELFYKGCPAKIMEEYPIRYLLTKNDRVSVDSCGKELFKNQEVKLIKLQN